MNQYSKFLSGILFSCAIGIIIPIKSEGQTSSVSFISERVPQLKELTTELNQNVLPLLALIKEFEKNGPLPVYKVARIIKPNSTVKETDNINSLTLTEVRIDEEFPIISESDRWYRIKTRDNREGWIQEENVQVITKQQSIEKGTAGKISDQETSSMLAQMARYKKNVDDLYTSAMTIIDKTEKEYNSLSGDDKKAIEKDHVLFVAYKEKIVKYYNYAKQFLSPYEKMLNIPGEPQNVKIAAGGKFTGSLGVDFGRSSYENMNSNSTNSRNISFNGIYKIDNQTSMDIMLNQQKELIKTAFLNNNAEVGISHQFADKLLVGGNLNYSSYSDDVSDNNSFRLFRTGLNLVYTPSRKTKMFGNLNYQSKAFEGISDNNYQGIQYIFGANLIPDGNNNLRFQVLGNNQSGERDFLTFNQINPQLNYTHKKSALKSFGIAIDYDLLKFSATSSSSDYQKYKAEFLWRKSKSKEALSKNLSFIYKQFPNNTRQDYFRFGYRLEKRKGSLKDDKSSVYSLSYNLNLITQRQNNSLYDYLDVRMDKSTINPRSFFNANIYTRFWNNFKELIADTSSYPDHSMDFYSEFGPNLRNLGDGFLKITNIRLGLIFGGHLFFNFDNEAFNRNGNSARAGLSLSSNIKISKASLVFSGSYEWSFILCKKTAYNPNTGIITYGDDLLRKPTSLQVNVDFRQPVGKNWDFHLNFSTYNIRTDATFETSINPVDRKSTLRVSGGLIYRFSL
jgi:SH3-like domain-containing protein